MKHLLDGWLILVLALVFGSGLTAIQQTLGPIIKQNQKDKTYNRIPMLTLGADELEGLTIQPAGSSIKLLKGDEVVDTLRVEKAEGEDAIVAYRVYEGDLLVGYVLEGSGSGYADKIVTLIGLSADLETINGVSVIKQMETPNLGSKITTSWVDQYTDKDSSPPLEVVKNGSGSPDNNKIDAISGATISSRCLTDIVNSTVETFKTELPNLTWSGEASENNASDQTPAEASASPIEPQESN